MTNQPNLSEYSTYLSSKNIDELIEIRDGLDSQKYPERYSCVCSELSRKRKAEADAFANVSFDPKVWDDLKRKELILRILLIGWLPVNFCLMLLIKLFPLAMVPVLMILIVYFITIHAITSSIYSFKCPNCHHELFHKGSFLGVFPICNRRTRVCLNCGLPICTVPRVSMRE